MIRRLLFLFVLMAGFAAAQNRVYELRTYTTAPGKLEVLMTMFRDHTVELFKRHGIESIGYWVPQDPERSKNTLIYIVVHPSREAAEKNWAAFRNDPEWQKVAKESQADGRVTEKIESVFLAPADFSALK